MTIPVPDEALLAVLDRFGSAVMVTPRPDGWSRVLTVDARAEGTAGGVEVVIVAPHPAGLRRVAENPLVTLVWPSPVHHGHSLVLDGWGRVDGEDIRVRPDHAVLHRPGTHSDGPDWIW
ncbi:MAG: hypothetical protein E7Z94_12315 [Actinomyces ruminicola]|nr:hypothetical protein [Actinomyces ruminicola]